MFEYLMPMLVMPNYENTLLDQTCKAAVARQIEYGRQRGVPWGISESAYNTVDAHFNYQYRAFGVPGLGLKRVLANDLVIAPYASALALMVAPEAACANLQRMSAAGFVGRYGFYEAIDFTPARQRRGQPHAIVRSFMAHHQGMSLLALTHLLLDQPMQRRFVADRHLQAILPLLQERIPKATTLFSHTAELVDAVQQNLENAAPNHEDTPTVDFPLGSENASPSEPFSDSSKSFANSPSPCADQLRAKGERPSVRMELQDITAYLRNRAEAPKDRMPKLPVKIRRKEKVL